MHMCQGGMLRSILSLDPCCAVQIRGETGTTHSPCSTRYFPWEAKAELLPVPR
jgi:hypothetical protein